MDVPFERVGVLGLGLIGGSVALALREHVPVSGFDVDAGSCDAARADGLHVVGSLEDLVEPGSLVVVATPVAGMAEAFQRIAAAADDSVVVTDVGSVKQPVVAAARELALRFVGGHPMAGKELAGYGAAVDSLFAGCRWAVDLEDDTPVGDFMRVAQCVLATGAGVVPVGAAAHDRAVATVSHLPHVLAALLAERTLDDPARELLLGLAGGSFRDGTRVARSPAAFWTAVLSANRGALEPVLRELAASAAAIADQLARGDLEELATTFERGGEARRCFEERTGRPTSIEVAADNPLARETLLDLGARGGYISGIEGSSAVWTLHARVPERTVLPT